MKAFPQKRWNPLNPVTGGILLSIMMLLIFRYYYLQAITPPADLFSVDQITFSANTHSETVSKNIPVKQLRSLPDDWLVTSPDVSEGWYQANLNFKDKQTAEDLWAIYLPVVQMNAQIYINDVMVGRIGEPGQSSRYNDPFFRTENRPYYFSIPASLLDKSKNELKIFAQSDMCGSGLLGKIYLGEDRILRAIYEKRHAMLVTSIQTITAGMLAIAVLMSVLWVLRRQDNVYGWYALMLYTWSAHNLFASGINLPIPLHAQNIISLLALGWFVVFMVKATHHYMGQQFPVREKMMFGAAFIGSLAIVFSAGLPWSLLTNYQMWSTFLLMLACYGLLDFAVKYRDRTDLQNPLAIPAGFSMLAFGVHDWMLLMQFIPRDGARLLHFSAPVAVAVFGALLLERFADVLRKAESHNLVLEQRVAEKHRELETNFQRMREMENQQLLTHERERFMREMHDGVGGHLISMLSMVRSGTLDKDKIVKAIEAALDDLRLMIDSLMPSEQDIPSLLGAMRARIEPQLESSDLKLHWQVSELPAIADFGPHKALQVMRIIQEAVTNVIRHANAKNLIIKAFSHIDEEGKNVCIIEVSDDGNGLVSDHAHGNGLKNMKYRANDIGAKLDTVAMSPGTSVRLVLPC